MKKGLIIMFIFLLRSFVLIAQNEEAGPPSQESKIQERMREYIQDKLGLSKSEAERFTPVFVRYFREFVQVHRAFKPDKLLMQQKIIELRIKYRAEFRQIMDETRANKVYRYEDEFRQEAIRILKENQRERPFRRGRASLQ
jgi:hypothetical protein